jgi:hypothetical protein
LTDDAVRCQHRHGADRQIEFTLRQRAELLLLRRLVFARTAPDSRCRCTTPVRLLIMNRPAGFFSAIAAANTARAWASVRQIASVS